MDFLQPRTWAEALEAKAAHPDAVPVAGGTDVMVGVNFGHLRPSLLMDLTRVSDLQAWSTEDGAVRLGAGVSYARVITELGDRLPGLAMASRTIGSPQIRNRGTVGGNLATASPAGDAHPALWPPTRWSRWPRCAAPGGSRSTTSTPGSSATRWTPTS